MTNLRLKTSMWMDIDYCPFCGKPLELLQTEPPSSEIPVKICGYHIQVYSTENEDDQDEVI